MLSPLAIGVLTAPIAGLSLRGCVSDPSDVWRLGGAKLDRAFLGT